jgi:hypothetical protein
MLKEEKKRTKICAGCRVKLEYMSNNQAKRGLVRGRQRRDGLWFG